MVTPRAVLDAKQRLPDMHQPVARGRWRLSCAPQTRAINVVNLLVHSELAFPFLTPLLSETFPSEGRFAAPAPHSAALRVASIGGGPGLACSFVPSAWMSRGEWGACAFGPSM